MREYALYRGEEILSIGTIREIAEHMGVKYRTIMYYKTPSQKNRIKKNGRVLIELDEVSKWV